MISFQTYVMIFQTVPSAWNWRLLSLLNNLLSMNSNSFFSFPHPIVTHLTIPPPTADEESKDEVSNKKRRVETFQQKEKRKRDMGQATSDKNFVEEEKRILRQKIE